MRKIATMIVSLVLLTSCSSTKITTDQLSNINFTGYETYKVSQLNTETSRMNPINTQRVQSAIKGELASRELSYSEEANINIVWGFDIDIQKSYSTNTNYYRTGGVGFRGRYGYGSANSYSDTQEYETTTGTLQIAVIDNSSEEVIWIGIAQEDFKGNSKKAEEKINKIISEIFEEFPIDKHQS